jgi:hypothetical protein
MVGVEVVGVLIYKWVSDMSDTFNIPPSTTPWIIRGVTKKYLGSSKVLLIYQRTA